ncbi:MAG: tetratricopeptide repeat protein, partial [Sphingobium sp.]
RLHTHRRCPPLDQSVCQQGLIPIRERIEGPEALNTIITRHALACTTLYLGRAAEAEAMFRELLPLFEQAKGIDTISAYVPRYWLALAILERGDLNQAQALLDTIPDLSSKKSWLPRYAAKLAYVRGKTADALGKNDEALICLNEAQQIYAEIYPPDHFERKTVDTYLANRGAPS